MFDKLGEITKRVKKSSMNVFAEEATKTAFVLPFLQALGYDIFDPTEVVPEYTSDFAMKKGEKVDYAVRDEDKTIFLIECKTIGADLEAKHAGQLFRYGFAYFRHFIVDGLPRHKITMRVWRLAKH